MAPITVISLAPSVGLGNCILLLQLFSSDVRSWLPVGTFVGRLGLLSGKVTLHLLADCMIDIRSFPTRQGQAFNEARGNLQSFPRLALMAIFAKTQFSWPLWNLPSVDSVTQLQTAAEPRSSEKYHVSSPSCYLARYPCVEFLENVYLQQRNRYPLAICKT